MNRRRFVYNLTGLGVFAAISSLFRGAITMASNYPASLDTTATLPSAGSVGANLSTFPHSALTGNVNDAVIAIETELGVAPSGAETTVKARLDRVTPTLGVLTAWTPTVHQNAGDIAHTTTHATWSRVGRLITARFAIALTAAGSATTEILVGFAGLPASRFTFGAVGQGYFFDASTTNTYPFIATLATSNTFSLMNAAGPPDPDLRLGKNVFTAALASGDVITGTFCYEANTD